MHGVAASVKSAPRCADEDLVQEQPREQWGFEGYVVSDCGPGRRYLSEPQIYAYGRRCIRASDEGWLRSQLFHVPLLRPGGKTNAGAEIRAIMKNTSSKEGDEVVRL